MDSNVFDTLTQIVQRIYQDFKPEIVDIRFRDTKLPRSELNQTFAEAGFSLDSTYSPYFLEPRHLVIVCEREIYYFSFRDCESDGNEDTPNVEGD